MATKAPHSLPGISTVDVLPDYFYSGDSSNPQLRSFVDRFATPFDAEADSYNVSAFSTPIETKRSTAIFNMHTYWSKKPHTAIRQYVRHYTSSGDIVLDPFCGSGGTALAALMEGRAAIAVDRSPAATFIAKNHCAPIDSLLFAEEAKRVLRSAQKEMNSLYSTTCGRCGGAAEINYTILSQVFRCPKCLEAVALYDCVDGTGSTAAGKPKSIKVCPHCLQSGHQEEISTRSEGLGHIPVEVVYYCRSGCNPKKAKRHHVANAKEFSQFELARLEDIASEDIPYSYPRTPMMNVADPESPWGDKWRAGTSSFRSVDELYSRRNLRAVAALIHEIRALSSPCEDALLFTVTSIILKCSMMMAHNNDGIGRIQKGTYYVPQVVHDVNVGRFFEESVGDMIAGFREIGDIKPHCAISTEDSRHLNIASNSIDYIFTDPPYAGNVQYGELNFVWEAWLGFDTEWHSEEIVVNTTRGVSEGQWHKMLKAAMAECYRVLKPGRWLSLCYHDTSEGTWALMQDLMTEVGFVPENLESTLYIGTKAKTTNQYFADKVTKRDLVFNFRKPSSGEVGIASVLIPSNTAARTFRELAHEVIREFLTAHPGSEKDRIYDHLVSRMVRKGEMEAHDFDALLKIVAEEVRETVKRGTVDGKDADVGSHELSRWYLKETADHIDRAEQEKESYLAESLERFMRGYLSKHPEAEGVHYSDLFEQVIRTAVENRPRRLLESWLPEYFFKNFDGTWRPPADEGERQQKAAIREAGTLRRMKRFANALLEEVPVRDQDRPDSARTLAEWIRQCRRAGLYEQGRVMYEKGGLDLDRLNEDEQIEVEDDYRICVKRGSEDETSKNPKGRKKTS